MGLNDEASAVRLRPVEDRDIDVFFEHQADPQAVEMAAFPSRDRHQFEAHWARGRGVATRALALFVDELSTRPLSAHVVMHNVGSIRVLEKCGFRRDRVQEAQGPASDEDIEELSFVLDA